jgi:hypothetical protein
MACLIRRVQDLIVEHRKVESETEADWVGWCKIGLGNFGSILVSLQRLVCRLLALLANGELSEVTVVVTLPIRFQIGLVLVFLNSNLETHILW